jgi:hypothetical protein
MLRQHAEQLLGRLAPGDSLVEQVTTVGSCVAYQGCDDGHPVHWCQYSGGHTRPSFVPDAIWAFFEQF